MSRGDGIRRVHEIMSRIRAAIRDFDPSYQLKKAGHICAKEWREIIGTPLDFIWGSGYTSMFQALISSVTDGETLAKKVKILQDGAKDTVKLSDVLVTDLRDMWPETIVKYAMRDVKSVN